MCLLVLVCVIQTAATYSRLLLIYFSVREIEKHVCYHREMMYSVEIKE